MGREKEYDDSGILEKIAASGRGTLNQFRLACNTLGIREYHLYDYIVDGIVLTGQPLSSVAGGYEDTLGIGKREHVQHIKDLLLSKKYPNLNTVMRIMQPFARSGVWPLFCAAPDDSWGTGVTIKDIPCADEGAALTAQELLALAKQIDTNRLNQQGTVVFCQQGRGRSAMIVLAYLCTYYRDDQNNPFLSRNAAHEFLLSKRASVSMSEIQFTLVDATMALYQEQHQQGMDKQKFSRPR